MEILRITFAEGLFLKLQVVCLQRYCENFVTEDYLGIFKNSQKFFRIANFQNSGRLLQIAPEIIVQLLLQSTFTLEVLRVFWHPSMKSYLKIF